MRLEASKSQGLMQRSLLLVALCLTHAACQEVKVQKRRASAPRDTADVQVYDKVIDSRQSGKNDPSDSLDSGEPSGWSRRAKVRFKRQHLLETDLANVLKLDPQDLCSEGSGLSCLRDVHYLAVGGVEPYDKSIYAGLTTSAPTTPIVIERIVLSACKTRVERDFGGEGVIFAGLPLDGNGGLRAADGAETHKALRTLYRRALLRDARGDEIAALIGLYREIEAAVPRDAAKQWAHLACYAVMSSVEFVFH